MMSCTAPYTVSEATVAVALVVKAAIAAVWKAYAEKICRSPERPDLRMSQEEAQGWLIGALFARELLAPEARGIGKRVDYYASAEEKAEKAAKEATKSRKKAARKAKTEEAMQQKLEAIMTDVTAQRAARAAKVIDLGLPPVRSKVVESYVEEPTAADVLEELEAQLSQAEAELDAAESLHVAALHAAERATRALGRIEAPPGIGSLTEKPDQERLAMWLQGVEAAYNFGTEFPAAEEKRRRAHFTRYKEVRVKWAEARYDIDVHERKVAEAQLKVGEARLQLSEHELQMVKATADEERAAARAETQAALDKLAAALPNGLVCNGRVYGGRSIMELLAEQRARVAQLELDEHGYVGDEFSEPEVAQGVPVAAGAQVAAVDGVLV